MYDIKELDLDLIFLANLNSHSGEMGNVIAQSYKFYVEAILQWNVREEEKQKLFDDMYNKYSILLTSAALRI